MTNTDLLADIESFLARHAIGRARFGVLSLGDPCFIRELEKGRKPRSATEAKVRDWMEDYDARAQQQLLT